MIIKIFGIFKKVIVAVLLIYAYNKMAFPLNIYIPINVFTILMVAFCGLPSIMMLIFFSLICV